MKYDKIHKGLAATVAVYAKDDQAFLMVKRKWDPDKGKYAFPGGIMNVNKEDLYECGVRELEEETGVKIPVSELQLLDVRSKPDRDPKRHVVDVGFLVVVDKMTDKLKDSDETYPEWIPITRLQEMDLFLDHGEMFRSACEILGLGCEK